MERSGLKIGQGEMFLLDWGRRRRRLVAAAIAIASARQEAAVRVRPGSRGSDMRHFYDRPTNHDETIIAIDCNDGLDRSWHAADEDAPRREVADHTKLRYGCGVCVQRQQLVGGENHERMKHMKLPSYFSPPTSRCRCTQTPHPYLSFV